MAKRFTESDKWKDKWFRRLPSAEKLAYLYLLDCCDMAGTIELDEDLAEFSMGCPTDWDGLVMGSEGRLVLLPCGRLWVTKFIAFQNGQLSEKCNAHLAIIKLVERFAIPIDEGYLKGTGRVQVPLAKGPGNGNGNGNGNLGECEGDLPKSGFLSDPEFVAVWEAFLASSRVNHNWRIAGATSEAWLYELQNLGLDGAKAAVRFSTAAGAKKPITNGDHSRTKSKHETGKPKMKIIGEDYRD